MCDVTNMQAYSDNVDPCLFKSGPPNLQALKVQLKMFENLLKNYNVTICEIKKK